MIKVALNAEVHMNRTQSANKLKQKTILNYIEFGSCEVRRLTRGYGCCYFTRYILLLYIAATASEPVKKAEL